MAKKKKGLRNINPGDTVEFLNYITPDHIIRAKYNTGTNGMDITDVPQNLNSYIVLGGGSGVTVEPLSVTSNGLYTAPMGKAYTPVDVNVPVTPSVTVESLSVTSNGTYTAPTGKAYSPVDVNVPATPSVTVESLSVTSNGNYTAPAGKAYSPVDVNVPQTTIESLSVTINGTYNAPTGKAYDPVVVNVPQTTVESLSVTLNGTYTAPEGKAYSPVNVSVDADYSSLIDGTYSGVLDISGATKIRDYGLAYLNSVTGIKAGSVTEIGSYSISNMSGITAVALPSLTTMTSNAFRNDANLEKVDFGTGVTSVVASNMFYGDPKLNVLVIRKSAVVGLNNINAFQGTPFASGGTGGTLYVPSAQITSYQSSSNWTTILGYANNSIQAIEGSIYENAYVDGTPVN